MRVTTHYCVVLCGLGVASVLGVGGVVTATGEEASLPIRGLRIPLDHFEDGRVKVLFTADQARAPVGGDVEASEALVEVFDDAGEVETRVEAETCRFSRKTGRVLSEDAVRLTQGGMVITGVGLDWETGEKKVQILSQVRVDLKGHGGLGKVLPGRKRGVRSERDR